MAVTRNGFTVQPEGSKALKTFTLDGRAFKVWGPSVTFWQWWTHFLDAVEPATQAGWEGGYSYRKIAGTDVWSEHAAGTAIDWNASQHGRSGGKYLGWSADQVRVIRWGLATPLGKQIRWGADFSDPDPMHFELKSKALWEATDGWWK